MSNSCWELNDLDNQLIDLAFIEDLGLPYRDLTTTHLFTNVSGQYRAKIISKHKEAIIICGLPVVKKILKKMGTHCELHSDYQDGQKLPIGATLLTLIGPAQHLLMAERILLNFLQHLCAIASFTAKFVNAINHTTTKILDTRKTLPAFRHLEKYAVYCGGGVNHRMGLYDAMMIKDTHIDFLGDIKKTLALLTENTKKQYPVIVEVRNKNECAIVINEAQHKVSRVLLDNMSIAQMTECVALCKNKIATEASGNIELNTIKAIAECGVDFISIGRLTHSAGNVDLSMKCEI